MEQNKTSIKENKKDENDDTSSDVMPKEYGGVEGKEPTEYGDWQHNGRCTDF